jgi:hypothetical protein
MSGEWVAERREGGGVRVCRADEEGGTWSLPAHVVEAVTALLAREGSGGVSAEPIEEWEDVGAVVRLRIPGGWLVRARIRICIGEDTWAWSDHFTYVPDPQHAWGAAPMAPEREEGAR